MTLDDLCSLLDGLGIPWENEGFSSDTKPAPPYISLEAGFGSALYADNAAYARWMPYEILLYTAHRSYETESRIEAALDAAECAFEKAITHIDAEHLIAASFSVNVTE